MTNSTTTPTPQCLSVYGMVDHKVTYISIDVLMKDFFSQPPHRIPLTIISSPRHLQLVCEDGKLCGWW